MSKEYRQTSTGLDEVAKPKIKVYNTIADMETALNNGDLAEGELVSTVFLDAAGDNAQALNVLSDQVRALESYMPTGVSSDNKCVPQSELDRVERLIPADASTVNPLTVQSWVEEYIAGQLEPRDTAIASKASNDDLTAVSNRVTTIEGKIPSGASTTNQLATASDVTAVDAKFTNYELKTDATTFKNTITGYLPSNVSSSNKLVTQSDMYTFSLSGTSLTITGPNA